MKKINITPKKIIIVILIVFLVVALWNQPVYRFYEVKSNEIDAPIRIIHLSDLHSSSYGSGNKRLINKIKEQQPDIIVMTGDIVDKDNNDKNQPAYDLMEGLSDYPIYFISGNYEEFLPIYDEVMETIRGLGVTIVSDRAEMVTVNGQRIQVLGLSDASGGARNNKGSEETVNYGDFYDRMRHLTEKYWMEDTFTVLLSHHPEFHDMYGELNHDLVLSGHAHGGQVRIPFVLNGLFAPAQGFFPEYAGGAYEMSSGGTHINSRGLSFMWYAPRVFNPPEIVVIDVIPE